jgi:hypothetical protein
LPKYQAGSTGQPDGGHPQGSQGNGRSLAGEDPDGTIHRTCYFNPPGIPLHPDRHSKVIYIKSGGIKSQNHSGIHARQRVAGENSPDRGQEVTGDTFGVTGSVSDKFYREI